MFDTRLLLTVSIFSLVGVGFVSCQDSEVPDNSGAFTPVPAVELSIDQDILAFASTRADNGDTSTESVRVNNLGDEDILLRGFYMSGAVENYWVDLCEPAEATDICETPPENPPEASCEGVVPKGGFLDVDILFQPIVQETPEACGARDATITLVFLTSGTPELSFTVSGIGDSDSDSDGSLCYADDDCDDSNADIYMGAPELCDGKDNDCDDDEEEAALEANADRDLYRLCDDDCDDGDRNIYPGAPERCNGLDDNCNGINDDLGDEADADGDGSALCVDSAECSDFSSEDFEETDCTHDCDDSNPAVYPENTEVCDGIDNNCDKDLLEDEVDEDGDGLLLCEGDSDDGDATPTPTPTAPICD